MYSFFNNHSTLELIQIVVYYLLIGNTHIFIIAIIQKFTICHIFLPYQFYELIGFLQEFDLYENKFIISILMISFIFEIFLTFVFLEIIELKFCGLNKYIKKRIVKRAVDDARDSNASNDSLLEDENNNIYEISKGYIIDFDNQDILLEEEIEGEIEDKKEYKKLELNKFT